MPGPWSASPTTPAPACATWRRRRGSPRAAPTPSSPTWPAAGYVLKDKDTDGRRNRYQIQAHLPLPETMGRERTIGEVLDVLVNGAREPARV